MSPENMENDTNLEKVANEIRPLFCHFSWRMQI